jgi:hypothetical protein
MQSIEKVKKRIKEFKEMHAAISVLKIYVDIKIKEMKESNKKLQEIHKKKEGVNAFVNKLDCELKILQRILQNCTEKEVKRGIRLVWDVMNEMNCQMMFGVAPEGIFAQKRAAYHLLEEYIMDVEEAEKCIEDTTSNMTTCSFVEVINLVDVDNANISTSSNTVMKRKHIEEYTKNKMRLRS